MALSRQAPGGMAHHHVYKLEVYLQQCWFERSTQGDVLERQRNLSVAVDEYKLRQGAIARHERTRESWEEWDPNPVTAVPTAEFFNSRTEAPEDSKLILFGWVSRRLARLEALHPWAADALGRYYGIDGARCRETANSQAMALAPQTPAGKRLIEMHKERTKSLESAGYGDPLTAILSEATIQKAQPTKERRNLLALAASQGAELHVAACRAWNAVNGGGA